MCIYIHTSVYIYIYTSHVVDMGPKGPPVPLLTVVMWLWLGAMGKGKHITLKQVSTCQTPLA